MHRIEKEAKKAAEISPKRDLIINHAYNIIFYVKIIFM